MSSYQNDPYYDDETRAIQRADDDPPANHQHAWYETLDPGTFVAVAGSLIGAFILIVGIVTIARTGLPITDLGGARTVVGPYEQTALMGLIEIAVGLGFIGVGSARNGSGLLGLGIVSGVFGIVWMIEPNAFNDVLGIGRSTAVTYFLIGVISSVIGFWATNQTERVVVRR